MRVARVGTYALPGPPQRALVGDRGYAWTFDRHPLRYLEARFGRYGPVSGLAAADTRLVFAVGPACNAELRGHAEQFAAFDATQVLDAPHSATVRRLVADAAADIAAASQIRTWLAAVAQPTAAAYAATAAELAERTVERWGLGQQVDLLYLARRLNLGIVLHQLFGIDTTATPEREKQIHAWVLAPGTHAPRARQRTRRIVEQLTQLPTTEAGPGTLPLLSELAAAQRAGDAALTAQVADQIWSVVRAVEAPLTSTLAWTLLLLAQHERVLSDVQAELRFASGGATQGGATLPLLERVLKETLRLLPPHCLGLRRTTRAGALLGYELPRGAGVVHSPYLTHQLAGVFITARRFRPERWLYIEPTSDEYLPLGLPGESAVTHTFLLSHLKPVLAAMLRRSRLVLAAGAQVDYQLHPVLQPKGELPMIVAPLQRKLIQREVKGSVRELVDFGAG